MRCVRQSRHKFTVTKLAQLALRAQIAVVQIHNATSRIHIHMHTRTQHTHTHIHTHTQTHTHTHTHTHKHTQTHTDTHTHRTSNTSNAQTHTLLQFIKNAYNAYTLGAKTGLHATIPVHHLHSIIYIYSYTGGAAVMTKRTLVQVTFLLA